MCIGESGPLPLYLFFTVLLSFAVVYREWIEVFIEKKSKLRLVAAIIAAVVLLLISVITVGGTPILLLVFLKFIYPSIHSWHEILSAITSLNDIGILFVK